MTLDDFPQVPRQVATPEGIAGNGTLTFAVPDPGPGGREHGAWQIVSVTFRLTTDATVATRTPVLSVLGGDGVAIAVAAAGYGATANTTADYSYTQGLSEWDQSNNAAASGPAPTLPLDPGDRIQLTVGAGVVGDTVTRVHIVLAPCY
jgi:hypothetical protein